MIDAEGILLIFHMLKGITLGRWWEEIQMGYLDISHAGVREARLALSLLPDPCVGSRGKLCLRSSAVVEVPWNPLRLQKCHLPSGIRDRHAQDGCQW